MGKRRRRIGIVYHYNENWIGGTYYLENLVACLDMLPDPEKPELILVGVTPNDLEQVKTRISYPYLEKKLHGRRSRTFAERALDKISLTLTGKYAVNTLLKDFDLVFAGGFPLEFHASVPLVYWIPDFQEKHLPGFFSEAELERRINIQRQMSQSGQWLMFSSRDALKDFESFFPDANVRTAVLPFAVKHPDLEGASIETVQAMHGVADPYFMAPNQFWAHKNHGLVVEALHQLKNQGIRVTVLFTGKEYDHRFPGYTDDLKLKVKQLGLEDQVLFLGFIDRVHQLKLMQGAIAILQPSRFEGWSTVVEDAKALDKQVVASDLAVHREQLGDSGLYFGVDDPTGLAVHLRNLINGPAPAPVYQYQARQLDFARGFLTIAAKACEK